MNLLKGLYVQSTLVNLKRYVFEIYQVQPNASINNGLILPETNKLTATCAAWGEWSPKNVPKCIRK